MPAYTGFLRAINLGARRKFAMAELRACLTEAGLGDVETHIQTGNVRFTTRMRSRARVEGLLEGLFLADRGFEVPTIVLTPAELAEVGRDAEALQASRASPGKHYVTLLKHEPTAEARAALEALSHPGEQAVGRGRAVHLLLGEGYRTSTLDNARVERLLGVGTNRNYNVITTLAARWGSPAGGGAGSA
ncbi:DUF1697 domain-containing protein [Nocardioides sp.]|uniref:DUF1697 domain-containing protein n=1 Tax=Nocardioides sp. TaxID=35761 RepID=UPI0027356A0E|nr:DUF1697 domain-containing protein [Nocardioides sp.]MDP3892944.1 DUF1697 domain-containing protein [Nocardioides sp.]